MTTPLVTVVCFCHNQERFVGEALVSVYQQSYPTIELLVVDNGSLDGSVAKIEAMLELMPQATFLKRTGSQTTGAAFNQSVSAAQGEYLILLNATNSLVPNRIEKQVAVFETLDTRYGVLFSDAELIDENSGQVGFWMEENYPGDQASIASGNVYSALFQQNPVCSPTLMIRRSAWDALGGYDETIAYPEFDFQVRSARKYSYHYQNEVLTKVRQVSPSSTNPVLTHTHLQSILKACQKAHKLNSFQKENEVLADYIRVYLRQSLFTDNHDLVHEFGELLEKVTDLTRTDQFWVSMARSRMPLSLFYRQYMRFKSPRIV